MLAQLPGEKESIMREEMSDGFGREFFMMTPKNFKSRADLNKKIDLDIYKTSTRQEMHWKYIRISE